LENNTEGRSQAWILDYPGCFAYGRNGSRALQAVPKAISDHRHWIEAHTTENWFPQEDEFNLVETWECYSVDDNYKIVEAGYEVNAWFRHDWIPLREEDIQRGLLLLRWGREDLLNTVEELPLEILERTYLNERWNISGILKHIAGAEWWYLNRLGFAFPRDEVPEEPFERLDKVRSRLNHMLPNLVGSTQVLGVEGEFWSPRKLLRRAVWHEYDHIAHIKKLLR
jgi:hypothetical protein